MDTISNNTEICRICGQIDTKNIHIFQNQLQNKLSEKIMTIYPLIIYEDDPLPKYICIKCFENVEFQYSQNEQVLNNQRNLLANLKANDPGNSYINMHRIIEKTFKAATNVINAKIGEKIVIPQMNSLSQLKRSYITVSKKKFFSNNDSIISNGIESPILKSNELDFEKNFENNLIQSLKDECNGMPHLRLVIPKLFQKRYLNEIYRRGTPIMVNNNEYIRCQNCDNIYEDTQRIIRHWELGECIFYCEICSAEFSTTEILNDHILEIHGVNHLSIKKARSKIIPTKVKIISSESESEEEYDTNNKYCTGNAKIIKVGLAKMKIFTSSSSKPRKKPKLKFETNSNYSGTISSNMQTDILRKDSKPYKFESKRYSYDNFIARSDHKQEKHNKMDKQNINATNNKLSNCLQNFTNEKAKMKKNEPIGESNHVSIRNEYEKDSSYIKEKSKEENQNIMEKNIISEQKVLEVNKPIIKRVRKKFVPYREQQTPIQLSVKEVSKLKYLPANTPIKLLE